MRVQVNGNADGTFQLGNKFVSVVGEKQVRHILDTDSIGAHFFEQFCEFDKILDVVYGRNGVAYRRFADTAVFLYGFDGLHKVSGVVERVENSDYVNSVFDGFFNKFVNHVIRIMLVSEQILTSQKHLKTGFRHCGTQFAQTLPRVFVKETHTSVKRCAAPAFKRPIAYAVENFAAGEHILDSHSRCRLRLVRVTENCVCYK